MLNRRVLYINRTKYNRGFSSSILVTFMARSILAIVMTRSVSYVDFINQVSLKKLRIENYFNASNCIDRAILNITHDYFYTVSSKVDFDYLHCSIDIVEKDNDFRIIKTTGNLRNIYVKRQAKIKLYDNRVEIISIE